MDYKDLLGKTLTSVWTTFNGTNHISLGFTDPVTGEKFTLTMTPEQDDDFLSKIEKRKLNMFPSQFSDGS